MRQAPYRHIRIISICAVAAATLAGCAHQVDLIPLQGGRHGVGDVSFRGGGMSVRLDGKRYSGTFIPASSHPVLAALDAPPFAQPGPMVAGRYWGVQGREGPTGAVLGARDGSFIACRLTYDPPASIGSGFCRSDDGRDFGLRMR